MKDSDYEAKILRSLKKDRESLRTLKEHREAIQRVVEDMGEDLLCSEYKSVLEKLLTKVNEDLNYFQGHVDSLEWLIDKDE